MTPDAEPLLARFRTAFTVEKTSTANEIIAWRDEGELVLTSGHVTDGTRRVYLGAVDQFCQWLSAHTDITALANIQRRHIDAWMGHWVLNGPCGLALLSSSPGPTRPTGRYARRQHARQRWPV